MKFPTHLKIIFTTLLLVLHLNLIYGTQHSGLKNNGDSKLSTSSEGPTNHDTAPVTAEDFSNKKTETINCVHDFSYTHKIDEIMKRGQNGQIDVTATVLFTYYSFKIDKEDRIKITNSNSVTQLTFNYTVLKFNDLSKLPDHRCWGYLRVFACLHNQPLMIRFKVTEGKKAYHYYYALNAAAEQFRNIGVNSLDEPQEIDNNELIRYPAPENPTTFEYSKKIEKIWKCNFSCLCQQHLQATEQPEGPTFRITIIPSDE